MQSIYDYLIFTTKIEHDLEHDSKVLWINTKSCGGFNIYA
jgi:hypothetical protein